MPFYFCPYPKNNWSGVRDELLHVLQVQDRQTNTTEIITFPQTTYAAGSYSPHVAVTTSVFGLSEFLTFPRLVAAHC